MKKIITILLISFCFLTLSAQANTDSLALKAEKKSTVEKFLSVYLDNLSYLSITLLMTVESSFIPFPSEIIVPPAVYNACDPTNENLYVTDNKWVNMSFVVLFATLGAIFGAIINYFLAQWLGRPVVYWFVETRFGRFCMLNTKKVQKAEDYFVKNGNISTFFGRLIPAVRQLISIPAGLAKMKLSAFIFYTTLGAGIWNIVLAILGYYAHGQKNLIQQYSSELSWIFIGLGVLFVGYLVYKAFKTKPKVN